MGKLKDWIAEIKLKDYEASRELLEKRMKNAKYFSIYHLVFYLIFFIIGIYGIILCLKLSLTDGYVSLLLGGGIASMTLLLFSIKNYFIALDWARDKKHYEMMIMLKMIKDGEEKK